MKIYNDSIEVVVRLKIIIYYNHKFGICLVLESWF